jgi:hypothetical protein
MPDNGSAQSLCVASSSNILNNRISDESGKSPTSRTAGIKNKNGSHHASHKITKKEILA